MDFQPQKRPPLEVIQEESDQEEESESRTSSEEEYYPLQVDAQAEEVLEEKEEEEDEEEDDEPLRVLRPRRRSRLSRTNLSNIQSNNDEVQNVSVADLSTTATDVSKPSPQSDLREHARSGSLSLKASEISLQKLSKHTPSMKKKNKFKDELFPPWVVNLMINIEEATSHQLVIE